MSWAALRPPAMQRTTRLAPVAASPATKTLLANAGCWGLRNPMANSTRSALRVSFFPVGRMTGRPPSGLGTHSTSSTSTPQTRPSFVPMKRLEVRHHRRVHPSSWLELVFKITGHCGHGVVGLCPTGGFGMISILRDVGRTLSVARADAVASRIAATDDNHMFAFGVYAFFLAESLSAQNPVCWASISNCEVYALRLRPGCRGRVPVVFPCKYSKHRNLRAGVSSLRVSLS